jgi:hypothetical protein
VPEGAGSREPRRDWKDDVAGGVVSFVIEALTVLALALVAVGLAALVLLFT